jgi:hypothetical protein
MHHTPFEHAPENPTAEENAGVIQLDTVPDILFLEAVEHSNLTLFLEHLQQGKASISQLKAEQSVRLPSNTSPDDDAHQSMLPGWGAGSKERGQVRSRTLKVALTRVWGLPQELRRSC